MGQSIFLIFWLISALLAVAYCGKTDDIDFLTQLNIAQELVEKLDYHTVFSVRCNNMCIMASIKENKTGGVDNGKVMFHKSDKFIAAFIGLKADVSAAFMLFSKLRISCSSSQGGEGPSARQMALQLADVTHSKSLVPSNRPIACNYLLLDTHCSGTEKDSFGDIIKVDVSGNLFSCKAVAIGRMSDRLNQWIDTRGRHLASTLFRKSEKKRANTQAQGQATISSNSTSTNSTVATTDSNVDCNTGSSTDNSESLSNEPSGASLYIQGETEEVEEDEENEEEEEDAVEQEAKAALTLLWQCLDENYGLSTLTCGNYTVTLVTAQTRTELEKGSDSRGVEEERVVRIIGPMVVPPEVFTILNPDAALNRASHDENRIVTEKHSILSEDSTVEIEVTAGVNTSTLFTDSIGNNTSSINNTSISTDSTNSTGNKANSSGLFAWWRSAGHMQKRVAPKPQYAWKRV